MEFVEIIGIDDDDDDDDKSRSCGGDAIHKLRVLELRYRHCCNIGYYPKVCSYVFPMRAASISWLSHSNTVITNPILYDSPAPCWIEHTTSETWLSVYLLGCWSKVPETCLRLKQMVCRRGGGSITFNWLHWS